MHQNNSLEDSVPRDSATGLAPIKPSAMRRHGFRWHHSLLDYALSCRQAAKGVKWVHRLVFGKTRRHSIDLWPYLRLQRNATGAISHLSINGRSLALTPIEQVMAEAQPQQALHLIATGPSIEHIDYSQIHQGIFLGLNGAIELQSRYPLSFQYYVIFDQTFVIERANIVAKVLAQPQILLFTTPKCLLYIHKILGLQTIRCRLCVLEEVREHYNRPGQQTLSEAINDPDISVSANHQHGFSLNPGRGLFGGGTVAYVALQIAAYLKYRTQYLHGVDLGNANQRPRFYETAGDRVKSHLVEELDSLILPSFSLAAPLLRARHITVYNLSAQSALPETLFRKIDAQSLYATSPEPPPCAEP